MDKIDREICLNHGIKGSELIALEKFNVIIGKNGAGKTRLLNAIRECFQYKNKIVIYAYFPDMVACFDPLEKPNAEYDVPLYEMIFKTQNIQIDNLIRCIEHQGYSFLKDILKDIVHYQPYKNSMIKARAEEVQGKLNEVLELLIDRRLIFSESEIMVESTIIHDRKKLESDMAQMSPGELALFYMSILLILIEYSKQDNQDMVVLLDEPELHLHPKALLGFMDYLKRESMFTTCCIATHSVFLIPSINFSEIIYIEKSTIQPYNSNLYNQLFDSVIGVNEELCDFLISRDMWQYYNFITECFCKPNVVSKVNTKDEQFLKFKQFIDGKRRISGKITVLDYGAGSGRLGKTIKEEEKKSGESKVKYYYYDKYETNVPDGIDSSNAWTDIRDIIRDGRKFDCVVLMNVLHEIDVNEWEQTFADIYNILEDNGYLLIFEVIALLHGEQPWGKSGYILLGECEIRELFHTNNINMIKLDDINKTNMFVIRKGLLRKVNKESVTNALEALRDNLFADLKNKYIYRREKAHSEEEVPRQWVKTYGFLTQHYLNSIFALEILRQTQNEKITQQDIRSGADKSVGKKDNVIMQGKSTEE